VQANTSKKLAQFESKKSSGGIFNRVLFWGLGAGLFVFISLIAHWEPVVGDGWYVLDSIKKNSITLSSLFESIARNYMRGNPRIGQWFAPLSYANGPIHELLTPLMIVLLLGIIFTISFGRMPKPAVLHDMLCTCSSRVSGTHANIGGSAKWQRCPNQSLYAVPEIEVVLWR
jgi:hypothetical protein